MSPAFQALRNARYRWFLLAVLVTSTGTWMQRIAQDWLVLDITGGNATALGLTTALQFAPFVVITPLAGVFADRWNRKVIMQVTASIGMLSAGLMAFVVISGQVTTGWVYLLALLLGTAAAVDHPARQAFLGEVVTEQTLANAVALNSATFNLSRILGPAMGGLVIAAWGVGPVFALNAVSFAVAVMAIAMVRIQPAQSVDRRTATFRDGLRYLRENPDLVVVIAAVGIAATFAFNYALFTVLMAREEFAVGAHQFGVASSVLACGSIVGSLVAARMPPATLRRVFVAGVAFGAATFAAGLMPTYPLFVAFLPLAGLAALTFSVAAQSYLQLHSAMTHRGRVMGMYTLVFFGGNPIGAPVLGWVSDTFGPRWTLMGGGLVAAVGLSLLALVARRWLRRVDVRTHSTGGGHLQAELISSR